MAILDINNTSLKKDVNKIINSPDKVIFYSWEARVHNKKYNLNILKIKNFDLVRNYLRNIGDHMHIEFILAAGDFYKYFFPYKENSYITITQKPRTFTNLPIKNAKEIKATYKLVYLEKENTPLNFIEASERFNKTALDLMDFITVKCQLLDLSLEALRILYTGGTFENKTYKEILYNTVGSDSLKVKINGKPSIEAIDISDPDNTENQTMTIIPDGTPIISIPTYLQEHKKGIYNSGIGMYLQNFNSKKTWFVYPLYNTSIYKKRSYKSIFYVVPPQHFPWVEKTYLLENKVLKIVCVADKRYISDGHSRIMDTGNGFRMSAAYSYMKKPVVMKKTGPVGSRSRMNYEVSNKDALNGLNYGPMVEDEISDNPYSEYSKITSRYTDIIHLVWNNSDPDLIHPGMPAKFFYLKHDKLVSITGVIINTQTSVEMANSGLLIGIYYSNTAISVLVDKGNSLDIGEW